MTDAHEPNETDGPHEGPIKTPKQLIMAVFCAFVIPISVIVLLAWYVTAATRPAAGSDAFTPASTAQRIQPVGHVEVKDVTDVASAKTGEQVFAGQCTACHTAGTLGAPKFGDAAAWAPRIKSGFDSLWHSALAGKGSMPPQGGGDFSDFEIARAVVYMANKGGAQFPDPKPPATTTTAAAAPAGSGATLAAGADANAGRQPSTTSAPLTPMSPSPTSKGTDPSTMPVIIANATGNAAATANSAAAVAAGQNANATPAGGAATTNGAPPPLYGQICSTCHAGGVAGAPKFGDKAAWAPRLAQGIDGLTASAIKGKNAMPPRGGSTASDADIKAVVTYMVNAAK
jgi:cytochrome c5